MQKIIFISEKFQNTESAQLCKIIKQAKARREKKCKMPARPRLHDEIPCVPANAVRNVNFSRAMR